MPQNHSITKIFAAKNGNTTPVTLNGYNIYRDGVRLNAEPVAETAFTDSSIEDKKLYNYTVTGVYAEGESNRSNTVTVDTTGSGIADITTSGITITGTEGFTIVTGAEGLPVEVFNAEGKTVTALTGKARTAIPLAQGFYIVKAGTTAAKIIVK